MTDSKSANGIEPGPQTSKKDELKFEDPSPLDRGILLANKIHELCEAGLVISEEYESGNLRPAAYTLRIGDAYIDSDGLEQRLSEERKSIVFRKNSIIFVSTKEKLELPYYIIARFNLRVNWVYNGILLGTGPQVDPGFSGYLSCPLYNLTDKDIMIRRGEEFATIDFEKTTSFLPGTPIEEKRVLIQNAKNKHLQPVGQEMHTFYTAGLLPALGWRKPHKIISSLTEMETEVGTWRKLGIGSVIAFFGLTLSLLAFGGNLYRQNSDLVRQVADERNERQQAIQKITKMEDDQGRLSRAVQQMQASLDAANLASRQNRHH